MFPKYCAHAYALPLIAALSFLAHVHYDKSLHLMKFSRHASAISFHGR